MYQVEVSNSGGFEFKIKSGDYGFTVDAKGEGITPPAALLAALGSCVGVYIRKYIESAKLALNGFDIVVSAEFSKEPPMCFRQIKVDIDLKGSQIDERRKTALLEFVKNCPVHNTLKCSPDVRINIV